MQYQFNYPKTGRKDYKPRHTVSFLHEQTKQPIAIPNVLSDSGVATVNLDSKYIKQLGITLIPGGGYTDEIAESNNAKVKWEQGKIWVKIGPLKPVQAIVYFADNVDAIIGRDVLNKFRVTYQWDKTIYEEIPQPVVATAAFASTERYSSYRNRI